jgi:hypothetical protein
MQDKVVEQIVISFVNRSELGIKKYGKTLDKNELPLIDWLQHSIEEKMDDILYMQRALNELNKKKKNNCDLLY